MSDISFAIKKHIKVLSENKSGWKKELCLVSWNGAEPKYDIREWAKDYDKCGKGVTLTDDEAKNLVVGIQSTLKNDDLELNIGD